MIDRARLLRLGRDQLSAWLPALLMGLFALGTWWLVRSAPQLDGPEAPRLPSHEPDYFMHDFAVQTFDATGQLKTRITGAQGHHYPDTDTLEVQNPRLQAWGRQGERTTATAQRALANGDGSEVQLFGQARVVRESLPSAPGQPAPPPVEFRGEHLHAFVEQERVSASQPVEITRGPDRFTGDRFDYDHASGVARLEGRVRGTIAPRPRAAGKPGKAGRPS